MTQSKRNLLFYAGVLLLVYAEALVAIPRIPGFFQLSNTAAIFLVVGPILIGLAGMLIVTWAIRSWAQILTGRNFAVASALGFGLTLLFSAMSSPQLFRSADFIGPLIFFGLPAFVAILWITIALKAPRQGLRAPTDGTPCC